ncbi:hypothetical protein ABEG18_06685 [Alsobacter sp. KACC 23698]|uniref:Uncharacterized protein n=1 Tax=Alsobacter sp. KACC 23698 TaxID=3149229 RepID=A0AAU7JJ88_9HYPH
MRTPIKPFVVEIKNSRRTTRTTPWLSVPDAAPRAQQPAPVEASQARRAADALFSKPVSAPASPTESAAPTGRILLPTAPPPVAVETQDRVEAEQTPSGATLPAPAPRKRARSTASAIPPRAPEAVAIMPPAQARDPEPAAAEAADNAGSEGYRRRLRGQEPPRHERWKRRLGRWAQ